jgi:hypothetical protein
MSNAPTLQAKDEQQRTPWTSTSGVEMLKVN